MQREAAALFKRIQQGIVSKAFADDFFADLKHHVRFRLTPRVLELGYSYLAGFTLPQIAEP